MYQFKVDINEKEYAEFLLQNPYYSFMQLPEWAQVKDNWKSTICGLYENEKLVAGAMLLIRPLPLGLSIIYAPRGFTMDYANKEVIKAFGEGVKKYGKKVRAISIKIDPFIVKRDDEKYGKIVDFKQDFETTINNLVECGFIHLGYGKDLHDYFQPRFNMAIPLFDDNGAIDEQKLLKSFPSKVRRMIGNFHQNRGVEFEIADANDDLTEFVRLLSCTEKRQNIHLRNIEYFQKIRDAYGDRAQIYYAKIQLPTYIAFLEKAIANEENVEKNQENLAKAQSVMSEKGESVKLATCLVIYPKDGENIKVAEHLYAGSDMEHFGNLSIPSGLNYFAACDGIKRGCTYLNLGGVDGEFKSSLATFKLRFAPHIFEFVGEFDLPVNKLMYLGFTKLLPIVKKILK